MPTDSTTVLVVMVIFIATLIRSTFGFGEALVAVPLLAMVMPVEVATPLATLASITVAGFALIQDWREVHVGSARSLILSTLPGIPLGLLLLTRVAEPIVKAALAVVIIAFSTYNLVGRTRIALKDDRLAWLFGFVAGIMGGAYGMNGPPLVIYGSLRRWPPERFRATLQGYFLPASVVGLFGYWLAGLWVPAVTRFLPRLSAGDHRGDRHWAGWRTADSRVDLFVNLVNVCLILIGVFLLLQAASGLRSG